MRWPRELALELVESIDQRAEPRATAWDECGVQYPQRRGAASLRGQHQSYQFERN